MPRSILENNAIKPENAFQFWLKMAVINYMGCVDIFGLMVYFKELWNLFYPFVSFLALWNRFGVLRHHFGVLFHYF